MKTLKAFWHWVDNEKPTAQLCATKAGDNLSEVAHAALLAAERLVCLRAGADVVEIDDRVTEDEHRAIRPALRDLSLTLCAALEHMHGQVEPDYLGKRYPARPDFQTHATFARCDACGTAPCIGTHISCDVNAYLAGRPEARTIFKREYLGDWVKGVDLAADASEETKQNASSGWAKMQQLANMSGYPRLLGGDGLKMLRPGDKGDVMVTGFGDPCLREPIPVATFRGKVASTWDPGTRELHVYSCIERGGVERLRGLSPRRITLRGKDGDYAPEVLAYLREVLAPMVAGTLFTCPDGALLPSEW